MQEEMERRSLMLAISAAKMSGRVLSDAVRKYLSLQRGERVSGISCVGRQSIQSLMAQGQELKSVKVNGIEEFEQTARAYGLTYAVKKAVDQEGEVPKYLVFFKARDGDVLDAALNEFARRTLIRDRKADKPPVSEPLKEARLFQDKEVKEVRHAIRTEQELTR